MAHQALLHNGTRRLLHRPGKQDMIPFHPCLPADCSRTKPAQRSRHRSKRLQPRAILLTTPEVGSDTMRARGDSADSASASLDSVRNMLVPTHFAWTGKGTDVELWGSWNAWEQPVKMHRVSPDHPFRAVIPMPLGGVEYKYKVDGAWCTSLKEETVNSNQGHLNNFRVVHPTLEFAVYAPGAQRACVVGDWDNWTYSVPLEKDPATGAWVGCTHLRPGQYCYQYIFDNKVTHNSEEDAGVYPGRGVVNMAWAVDQTLFRIFYCTKWEDTILHYRRVSGTGQRDTKHFNRLRMVSASSRGNDLGRWFMGVLVPMCEGEQVEFYLTNGKTDAGGELKEDRPGGSKSGNQGASAALYTLPRAGSYKLSWGNIRPFPRGAEPRYMLVSDIDGTMIGEHGKDNQFTSSRRFRDYWESGPALAGSILVYNTGRSIGQVRELLKTQQDGVATPDACIVAVGTKVFLNMEEVGRAHTSGLNWVEDMEWTRQLDEGWNLNTVRKYGRKLMDQYGNSGQLSVLDDGSEHQHRFSFSADVSIVEHVRSTMMEGCAREGLDVRIIVSGTGGHRYVDCVSMAAGKEKALQFLRAKYDIPEHYCVAAGDSGNDVLMLEGDHPSIVVGNAQPELLAWLVQQPQTGKVVLADAPYADGIMEGLARHGLF